MIGKQHIGSSFYGVLQYHQKKKDDGMGEIIDSNMTIAKSAFMAKEFEIVSQLRPNLKRAVYHTSLSLPYEDYLSDEKFAELGNYYLNDMGFTDNQFIILRHFDEKHQHIHILANRVRFDGTVVSDGNNYKRSEVVVRKLEKQFKLSITKGSEHSMEKALTMAEIQKTFREGKIPIKLRLQQDIKETLLENLSLEDFTEKLKKLEIYPQLNRSKTTGHISGISFKYEDIIYKGSSLGKGYSWNKLKLKLQHGENTNSKTILNPTVKNRAIREETRVFAQESKGVNEQSKHSSESTRKGSKSTALDKKSVVKKTISQEPKIRRMKR